MDALVRQVCEVVIRPVNPKYVSASLIEDVTPIVAKCVENALSVISKRSREKPNADTDDFGEAIYDTTLDAAGEIVDKIVVSVWWWDNTKQNDICVSDIQEKLTAYCLAALND